MGGRSHLASGQRAAMGAATRYGEAAVPVVPLLLRCTSGRRRATLPGLRRLRQPPRVSRSGERLDERPRVRSAALHCSLGNGPDREGARAAKAQRDAAVIRLTGPERSRRRSGNQSYPTFLPLCCRPPPRLHSGLAGMSRRREGVRCCQRGDAANPAPLTGRGRRAFTPVLRLAPLTLQPYAPRRVGGAGDMVWRAAQPQRHRCNFSAAPRPIWRADAGGERDIPPAPLDGRPAPRR